MRAMPPAVYEMAANAFRVIEAPTVASIPTAAMPIPYSPAASCATHVARAIRRRGIAVDSIPIASPMRMAVAAPPRAASAMRRMGREVV